MWRTRSKTAGAQERGRWDSGGKGSQARLPGTQQRWILINATTWTDLAFLVQPPDLGEVAGGCVESGEVADLRFQSNSHVSRDMKRALLIISRRELGGNGLRQIPVEIC